ncbi:MAG: alkaline phosphatase family protein [Candidatus Tectomicrobia bacterium]|uniref:Alkaline phosphatase family protein n=1 Tax=Tectimicrobiota bacterium TaxID=2528274 RepID=A0A932CM28_UNCTE|nr:alkaline phosphatase family protein [Candidatus Tectomicrobia bacterium]
MRGSRPLYTVAFLIGLGIFIQAFALPAARSAQRQASAKPRLVIVLIIDQFRPDYLDRFGDLFGQGGFRRLIQDGALFTQAHFLHTPTFTAPGHATILTGSVPALNGIVGNYWWDYPRNTYVSSVGDPDRKLLGTDPGPAASPHRLIGTTVGDELRLSNHDRSKVIGLSFKDRSAILPAGKRPTAAYWFHTPTGRMVSSDYYFAELPAWVKRFNAEVRPDRYFKAKWDRILPEAAYARQGPDGSPFEIYSAYGRTFPYLITGGDTHPGPKFYAHFEQTPFANEYLFDFARAAIRNEQLGRDPFPDLLTISLSANDLVGHAFGPLSHEVMDLTLRTDRMIADFLSFVEAQLGLRNVLLVLTSDHGVSPIPEQMAARGMGRKRILLQQISEAVERALDARHGEDRWVVYYSNEQIYLNRPAIAAKGLDRAEVERTAGEASLTIPGVLRYYTRTALLSHPLPDDRVARRIQNGFFPERSGDVALVIEPFTFVIEESFVATTAATHGSPYTYDTHVPIFLMGPRVRPGRYYAPCSPADIAPTLCALLGIQPPSGAIGRVLAEAIR